MGMHSQAEPWNEKKGFHSGSTVPTLNRNDIHALTTIRPYRDLIEKFEEQQNKAFSHVNIIVLHCNNYELSYDLKPSLIVLTQNIIRCSFRFRRNYEHP